MNDIQWYKLKKFYRWKTSPLWKDCLKTPILNRERCLYGKLKKEFPYEIIITLNPFTQKVVDELDIKLEGEWTQYFYKGIIYIFFHRC